MLFRLVLHCQTLPKQVFEVIGEELSLSVPAVLERYKNIRQACNIA